MGVKSEREGVSRVGRVEWLMKEQGIEGNEEDRE